MPLTLALHCSMVKKPQFVPPPAVPEYWARTIEYYRRAERWRALAAAPLAP
jgi:hypothetical protein